MPTNTTRLSHPLWALGLSLATLTVTASPARAGLAWVSSIEGRVELRRDGWSRSQRALTGTALYGPDILRPARGSRVVVICPNGRTRWTVPAGTISAVNNGCPGTPSRLRPQFGIGDLQGGSNSSIPYVITPRTDLVLSPRPLLRWNPVEGAKRYRVMLASRGETLWQIDTDRSEIPYPASQLELMPRQLYTLTVTADTGASSADEALALRFNVLAETQAEAAQAEIDAINAQDISDELKTLMLVQEVYPNYQLTAAAVNDLERLIASGVETAQVYRLLGDVYLKSGLRLLAEESYLEAVTIAMRSHTLEEQVRAQLGLGTLYSQVGERDSAMRQLRCAQAGAATLGDERMIESIDEALAGLM